MCWLLSHSRVKTETRKLVWIRRDEISRHVYYLIVVRMLSQLTIFEITEITARKWIDYNLHSYLQFTRRECYLETRLIICRVDIE